MAPPRQNISVLVIEDDRTVRSLAMQSLASYKGMYIQRLGADTKELGMSRFALNKPDIVLLDIRLPDGNGLDALEEMLRLQPAAFIVMMTSSRKKEDVVRAKELGAMGYIIKPFNIKRMHSTVEVFLNYRRKISAVAPQALTEALPTIRAQIYEECGGSKA